MAVARTGEKQPEGDKQQVWLDRRLIEDARKRAGDASRSDDDIIAERVSRSLLRDLLHELRQRQSDDLTDEDAMRIAYEELHAMRREHRHTRG